MSQSNDKTPRSTTWIVGSGETLGRAIAEIRALQNLTQAQLAAQVGLSRAYLSQIETGRTSSILEHELRSLRRMGARITITFPSGSEVGEA